MKWFGTMARAADRDPVNSHPSPKKPRGANGVLNGPSGFGAKPKIDSARPFTSWTFIDAHESLFYEFF